jgi:manganese oxidase
MTTIDHSPAPAAGHDPADEEPDAGRATVGEAPVRRPGLNTDTVALAGLFVAVFALLAALVAVGLAARAIDEQESGAGTAATESPASGATEVSLTEFSISPGPLEVPAGSRLTVTNDGSVVHNLSVDGTATPMLEAGESATLDLNSLAPGSYTMICDVAGHAAAGMETTIEIG